MPGRSFTADAVEATATSLPVPRGIAFRIDASSAAAQQKRLVAAAEALPGWDIQPINGLPGWFEAVAPAVPVAPGADTTRPIALGDFWQSVRALSAVPGVESVDPLFLIATPPPDQTMSFGLGPFGDWGDEYDDATQQAIEQNSKDPTWHLKRMQVEAAWNVWKAANADHPEREPGHGVVVAHPDTGFTDHPDLLQRFLTPGRSFLRDANGGFEPTARDDLLDDQGLLPEQPGHGTATASVIASGKDDNAIDGQEEILGVAPGARVLPLRVSRTVIHIDFEALGNAILFAVEQNADVISMSLGGPLKSKFLRSCIARAHEEGMIVISAAGNFFPTVMFPAAFPEVIAAAATHAAGGTWRYSGLGHVVDIAAPGEQVWRAKASLDNQQTAFTAAPSTGTSYAVACVAGLAALWLSRHGGRDKIAAHYGGKKSLIPFAFQYQLAETATTTFPWVDDGKYGAGIPNAELLLGPDLPNQADVENFEKIIRAQKVHTLSAVTGLLTGIFGVTGRSTVALNIESARTGSAEAVAQTAGVQRAEIEAEAEAKMLQRFLGARVDDLGDELIARIAADRALLLGVQRWEPGRSLLPLFDRLLDSQDAYSLSPALREELGNQRQVQQRSQYLVHRGRLGPHLVRERKVAADAPPGPPAPAARFLRAYAFDPSQETALQTSPISQVTIPVRWEQEPLQPGPVGEYLEVVDIDPASGCLYAPVDLNHPHLLAQNGLPPSEGDPQFHQQMVYAVAMNTINRFELALGRPVFWSPVRPWFRERPEERRRFTPEALEQLDGGNDWRLQWQDRYVQRLRVYPHALREANAYYSPEKRALLFGYFPGADDDSGKHLPGGMVFTCLSHDIIAHETTHALLDGMHPYFNEPSNPDVWAFHEAFADIMALFQHFTFPDVLRHQIVQTRGNLQLDNLLAQLAQQFGQATGGHGALRNALGGPDAEGKWTRATPDPRLIQNTIEPHARGSILVAAVFDAFLALYEDRVADLLRIGTGGTGVLPEGHIHPDLAHRLASEAAEIAEEVLRVCIRSMDYVPPVDITFGEFLRALITADFELAPSARRKIRIAFIEAFRAWGIYPRDVSTLSEDSLRWRGPERDTPLARLTDIPQFKERGGRRDLQELVRALEAWQPGSKRAAVFQQILVAQATLHVALERMADQLGERPLIPGMDLRSRASFDANADPENLPSFSVANLRPARRLGQLGDFRTEMVVELVQSAKGQVGEESDGFPMRGGATLIVDLNSWEIRYIIHKRLYEKLPVVTGIGKLAARFDRQRREREQAGILGASSLVWQGEDDANATASLAATYASAAGRRRAVLEEPFALLHRGVS